jgi:hypothetical protein
MQGAGGKVLVPLAQSTGGIQDAVRGGTARGLLRRGQRGLAMGVPKRASVQRGQTKWEAAKGGVQKGGQGATDGLVLGGSEMRFFVFFAVFGGLKNGRHIIYYM